MTSSATRDFLSSLKSEGRIPANNLAYFQTRLASRLHQAILKVFAKLESETKFARKVLARRIGRSPEQITRWFSYPGNLTLSTASDIFVGMGFELESFTLVSLDTGVRLQCPEQNADWGQFTSLYEKGAELAASTQERHEVRPPDLFGERSLASSFSNWQWNNERRREPSALSELLSPHAGIGRAESAQFQSGRAIAAHQ